MYLYVYVYTSLNACIHIRTHKHFFMNAHVRTYVCMYTRVRMYLHIYTHVYLCKFKYIHTRIHVNQVYAASS